MQAAAFQPRVSNASLAGQRPLEWPMVETLRKRVWAPRMEGLELENTEKKYLRDKDTLQDSYKDFEAFFVTQLLNAMQKTVKKNDMFHGGQAEDMFTERMNDEIGKRIVEGGQGFGIAEMLEQQHLRKTYYSNEKLAKAIWKDLDSKTNKMLREAVTSVEKANARLAKSAEELGEEAGDTLKQVASNSIQNDAAKKLEALAKEGLNAKADASEYGVEKKKNLQERMAELQAASAYDFKKTKGFSIR